MTEASSLPPTGIISVTLLPQENGYLCQLSPALGDTSQAASECYGQSQEHALAIALEQLAEQYRQLAEAQQNLDWDAVERSASGEPVNKHYHVILHYERIAEEESKFEAMHNTILGNTVVENAKITIVEIDPSLPIEPQARSWR
jgi:phosphoribosylformylglycinamidine (FGAM) synthase PurS component